MQNLRNPFNHYFFSTFVEVIVGLRLIIQTLYFSAETSRKETSGEEAIFVIVKLRSGFEKIKEWFGKSIRHCTVGDLFADIVSGQFHGGIGLLDVNGNGNVSFFLII